MWYTHKSSGKKHHSFLSSVILTNSIAFYFSSDAYGLI
jgi:hypothetical protein